MAGQLLRAGLAVAMTLAVLALAGPAQAGVVLAGAPAAVLRAAAAGKMPQPPVVYDFLWSGACSTRSALGCTFPERALTLDPTLLRAPGERVVTGIGNGVPLLSFVLLHELGHVFDREMLSDDARAAFMRVIGRQDGWWSAAAGPPPAELFADAYSVCSLYGARISRALTVPVGYGWMPTPALEQTACGFIRDAGRRSLPAVAAG